MLYDFWSDRSPVRSPDLPPMPPVALAPFRRNGMSGPVRGIGRHVRARAVIVLLCRSGNDIYRIVVDVGRFGALGHGDFGGGERIPPMSAMSMGATERDRSRFQRRPMALCDREGLSGSTHGSRSVCLRGTRAIVALFGFGGPDNPEDGLPLGVKEGSPPAFRPSPEVRTGLIFSVTRVV